MQLMCRLSHSNRWRCLYCFGHYTSERCSLEKGFSLCLCLCLESNDGILCKPSMPHHTNLGMPVDIPPVHTFVPKYHCACSRSPSQYPPPSDKPPPLSAHPPYRGTRSPNNGKPPSAGPASRSPYSSGRGKG